MPKPDEFTSNTIHSNVTTDKESYENSGAALSGAPRLPGDDSQQTFGVAPLPATSGAGNPISLRPGEKVPNPSSFTANTIRSGITTDEESYEKGSATSGAPQLPDVVTPQKERDQRGGGLFGLPPVSGNMIPESSLPMGAGPASEPDPGFTIQSAGPATSTAELAGKVPLEPTDRSEGVPQIVKESQEKAHVDPEASGSPELVKEKSTMEQELKREVESEPVTSEGAALAHRGKSEPSAPASGVPDVVQDSQHQAHADPEASSSPVAVKEKSAMENELRSIVQPEPATSEGADVVGGSTSNPTGAAAGVPEVVQDSQQRAHADPEASSSPVAVQEKSAMEDELRSIVQPEPATSDAVAVAGGSSSSKPIGAAAGVPEVVQDSQQRAHVDPEASSSPVAVQEKSAMEEELQSKIPQEPTVAEGTSRENGGSTDKDESALSGGEIMGVAAGGAAIGGITAAGLSAPDQPSLYGHSRDLGSGYLPPSIQQSINEINSSYKGTTTSTLVPDVVQQSISTSHQSPEAPSNQEAVAEKSALERELLSELKPAPVSSESAPDTGATSTMGASSTPSAGVPEVVQGSITKSHQSPGAAANKEAVAEKQAMEDELLRKIPSEEAAGEPAPPFSSAVVSLAPAPTISTTASAAPIDTSMPATTGTKNMTEETPLTSATVTSPSEDGLAAPAAMPAMTPTTKQVEQQKAATDSRDVSPMSKRVGTDTQTQPTVTTGVGESKTEGVSKSAPQDVSTPAPKQDVSTPAPKTTSASKTTPVGTGGGSSSAAAVRQSSPGSAKTAESTTSDKKAKRRSFFGKLKDKLK